MTTEILAFPNDFTPLDLLLWRRYGREIAGLEESILANNPGLADLCPFPPRGTTVVVEVPPVADRVPSIKLVRLF